MTERAREVRRELRKIRRLFGPKGQGWRKGAYWSKTKRGPWTYGPEGAKCFCVVGAWMAIDGISETRYALTTTVGVIGCCAAAFNDRPSTRFRDILKWLDRAAEFAKNNL